MRRRAIGVVALLVCAGAPGRADDLGSTHGELLKEIDHDVDVTVAGGLARMVVTRTLENTGERPDEAWLSIDLPTGSVARALRVRLGDRWYDGQLLDADTAEQDYLRLTTSGDAATRGPVLLRWGGVGTLDLSAYPVPAGGRLRLEYTLEAPLCYAAGHYLVDYPFATGPGLIAPALRARGGRVFPDTATVAGALGVEDPHAGCDPMSGMWNDGADVSYLVFRAPEVRPLAARYGYRAIDDDLGLGRIEIDAAEVLEPAPRGAAIVFVVDGSRSVSAGQVDAQLRAVRAYLAHVPDARFEVVVYRRRAERLFGRLVPAADAAALLDGIQPSRLERGNGSNLDGGLAAAAAALADHRGPTRIIAFTDDLLRAAFTLEAASGALATAPPDTIVHVAGIGLGGGSWGFERDDDHPLAPLAAATGGMAVILDGGDPDPDAAARALEGLVRPMRLDAFDVEVAGVSPAELGAPAILEEGRAFRRSFIASGDGPVVVRGLLWNRPFERRVSADARLSSRLPALIFGTELWSLLPEEELPALASAGGVVSPVTSFLARDPRAGPSGWPYESSGVVSGICGGSICGTSCIGIGRADGYGTGYPTDPVDRQAVLLALIADRARGCFSLHGEVADDVVLDLETTRDEIVDVTVASATSEPLGACLREAAWELALDDRFVAAHDRYSLHLVWSELPAQ